MATIDRFKRSLGRVATMPLLLCLSVGIWGYVIATPIGVLVVELLKR